MFSKRKQLTTLQLFHVLLPQRQRDCLQVLALFLSDVAAMGSQNRMRADNLSKVWPSFSKKKTSAAYLGPC